MELSSPSRSAITVCTAIALFLPATSAPSQVLRDHAPSRTGEPAAAQVSAEPLTSITLPSGVPMFVSVTHTSNVRRGAAVEGTLIEPLYVYDRLVLPKGAVVHGVITATTPVHGMPRAKALLDGDVTPLKTPTIRFDRVVTPAGELRLLAEGTQRNIKPVRFVPGGKRPSLVSQAKTLAKERIGEMKQTVFGPGKKDRATRLLYSQLPYHPQRIWAGTTFVADTTLPTSFVGDGKPRAAMAPDDHGAALNDVHVMARLASDVSSDTAAKGDTVTAIVTEPVFDPQNRLLLPEGAQLSGKVVQSKPSRSFGRNGQLRFLFQGIQRPGEAAQQGYGVLRSAAGEGSANLSVDSEGGVKANPEANRFLAPLLLGALAAAGHDRDRDGGEGGGVGRSLVASNGFGLIARIIALTVNDRNVATGFGAYATAKSVYFRFLTRGQPVAFAKDTPLEIQLQTR